MVKNTLFWMGILLVMLTHVYMLVAGIPQSQMMAHAIINLFAAGFILFSRR